MQQSQSAQSKPVPEIELDNRALRASTLARMWDCSRGHIYNLINSGQLRTVRIGSEKRILLSEVNRFLKAGAEQGTSRP